MVGRLPEQSFETDLVGIHGHEWPDVIVTRTVRTPDTEPSIVIEVKDARLYRSEASAEEHEERVAQLLRVAKRIEDDGVPLVASTAIQLRAALAQWEPSDG